MIHMIQKQPQRMRMLAWLLLPLAVIAAIVAAGLALTHAAPVTVTPPSGNYAFRASLDNGPAQGLYITGNLDLVSSTSTVSGHLCGLSVKPATCFTFKGTNNSGTVTFTTSDIVKKTTISATGTYQVSNGKKGSFTGISGTFSFGASTGKWYAYINSSPNLNGSWALHTLVQRGKLVGTQTHGTVTLTQAVNGSLSGQYCPDKATCVPVKGTNQNGYVRIYIGSPATMVLRGTFETSSRLSGKFYMNGTNNVGYWLLH